MPLLPVPLSSCASGTAVRVRVLGFVRPPSPPSARNRRVRGAPFARGPRPGGVPGGARVSSAKADPRGPRRVARGHAMHVRAQRPEPLLHVRLILELRPGPRRRRRWPPPPRTSATHPRGKVPAAPRRRRLPRSCRCLRRAASHRATGRSSSGVSASSRRGDLGVDAAAKGPSDVGKLGSAATGIRRGLPLDLRLGGRGRLLKK